jgi:hypothetical protein
MHRIFYATFDAHDRLIDKLVAMCTRLRRPILVLVLAGGLLACCKNENAPANLGEPQPMVPASGSPDSSQQPVKSDSGQSNLDAEGGDGFADFPTPPTAATKASKADLARLRRCCRSFDQLGQAKKSQEGAGLIGLSSVCDDIASALEHGDQPRLNYSDWEMIRPVLDDRSVPASCRTLMLQFEKK